MESIAASKFFRERIVQGARRRVEGKRKASGEVHRNMGKSRCRFRSRPNQRFEGLIPQDSEIDIGMDSFTTYFIDKKIIM